MQLFFTTSPNESLRAAQSLVLPNGLPNRRCDAPTYLRWCAQSQRGWESESVTRYLFRGSRLGQGAHLDTRIVQLLPQRKYALVALAGACRFRRAACPPVRAAPTRQV